MTYGVNRHIRRSIFKLLHRVFEILKIVPIDLIIRHGQFRELILIPGLRANETA